MKRTVGWMALGLWLALTTLCATAWADTVTLKDGTTVEGKVVSMDSNKVVMKVKVGSGEATMTLERQDVESFSLGEARPAKPTPPTRRSRSTARPKKKKTSQKQRWAPSSDRKTIPDRRVLFLIDRSGSMAIGKRWDQAIEQTIRLIGRLKPNNLYDVFLFHQKAISLYGTHSWMKRKGWSAKHLEERLRKLEPEMRAGTNLFRALRTALKRNPDRIVVITDGVITRGGSSATERALDLMAGAAERGIRVDFFSTQDGRWHAKQVENLSNARTVMRTLARTAKGVFLHLAEPTKDRAQKGLPETFNPVPGAPVKKFISRIEILSVDSGKPIVPKYFRPYPKFRIRVWDADYLIGKPLDVWEYGGSVWYEVIVKTAGGEIMDRVTGLRFHRQGQFLVANRYIQLTGTEDHRYRSAGQDRRASQYRTLQARPGATFEIIYHRGNSKLLERRFLRTWDGIGAPGSPGSPTPSGPCKVETSSP